MSDSEMGGKVAEPDRIFDDPSTVTWQDVVHLHRLDRPSCAMGAYFVLGGPAGFMCAECEWKVTE